MPYKDPKVRKEKGKEYSRKHYEANTEETKKRVSDKKKEERKKWDIFKRTLKCAKCGFSHPAALDFHHIDPSEKEGIVSKFNKNGQYKKAMKEIEKCIVLCSNCHRIHHYEEKNVAL
jgi:hypothetical protein